MKNLLAIDPGAGGGIAWGVENIPFCLPMPPTEGDLIDELRGLCAMGIKEAYIEDVGKGVIPGRAVAMIKLNTNAAVIRTALTCFGVRVVMVKPQQWQKHFGLGKRRHCASDTEWKNKLKAEAQRRFPNLEVTLATADALLLLDYGMSSQPREMMPYKSQET